MKNRSPWTETTPRPEFIPTRTRWPLCFSPGRAGACKYLIVTDRAITLKIVPTARSGLLSVLLNMTMISFNLKGKNNPANPHFLRSSVRSGVSRQLPRTDAPDGRSIGFEQRQLPPVEADGARSWRCWILQRSRWIRCPFVCTSLGLITLFYERFRV